MINRKQKKCYTMNERNYLQDQVRTKINKGGWLKACIL